MLILKKLVNVRDIINDAEYAESFRKMLNKMQQSYNLSKPVEALKYYVKTIDCMLEHKIELDLKEFTAILNSFFKLQFKIRQAGASKEKIQTIVNNLNAIQQKHFTGKINIGAYLFKELAEIKINYIIDPELHKIDIKYLIKVLNQLFDASYFIKLHAEAQNQTREEFFQEYYAPMIKTIKNIFKGFRVIEKYLDDFTSKILNNK